jgi:hypothetical protein
MGENLVLGGFLAVSLAGAAALVRFATHVRRAKGSVGRSQIFIGNLLALTFLFALSCSCGEIYYRFFYDTTDSLVYTKTSSRWFARHWRRNMAGLRDDMDYSPVIQQGKRRVSFFGDSFTAGHGIKDIEDRFANRIRRAHPEWEVHVMAMPGFDTGNELDFLKTCLTNGYQIDEVVLVYCLNDVSDLITEWSEAVKRINADVANAGWLRNNSYLIDTLVHRWKVRFNPDMNGYFEFVRSYYTGSHWEQQKQRLKEFRDVVQSHGGKLAVVTFPFMQALGPEYEWQFAHDELDQLWRDLGVPHLDLLPVFKDMKPGKVTVNRFDAHPNELAHAVAAQAIERFLETEMKRN